MGNLQFSFQGRKVLVTGGTRGIGGAISRGFLQAGAKVWAIYAGNQEAAQKFYYSVPEDQKKNLECLQVDVASYEQVERFFYEQSKKGIEFDIIVNNAGIRCDGLLGMMPKEDWERVLRTNLDGVFHVCRLGVMQMLPKRWGRIINLTSPSGRLGFVGQANYAAAKAGIVGLTKSLALEVGRKGVTVNCVCPGFIETDLIQDLPEDQRKRYAETTALKRFGRVEEVVPVVLFLASEEAGYITGSVYDVTGGI